MSKYSEYYDTSVNPVPPIGAVSLLSSTQSTPSGYLEISKTVPVEVTSSTHPQLFDIMTSDNSFFTSTDLTAANTISGNTGFGSKSGSFVFQNGSGIVHLLQEPNNANIRIQAISPDFNASFNSSEAVYRPATDFTPDGSAGPAPIVLREIITFNGNHLILRYASKYLEPTKQQEEGVHVYLVLRRTGSTYVLMDQNSNISSSASGSLFPETGQNKVALTGIKFISETRVLFSTSSGFRSSYGLLCYTADVSITGTAYNFTNRVTLSTPLDATWTQFSPNGNNFVGFNQIPFSSSSSFSYDAVTLAYTSLYTGNTLLSLEQNHYDNQFYFSTDHIFQTIRVRLGNTTYNINNIEQENGSINRFSRYVSINDSGDVLLLFRNTNTGIEKAIIFSLVGSTYSQVYQVDLRDSNGSIRSEGHGSRIIIRNTISPGSDSFVIHLVNKVVYLSKINGTWEMIRSERVDRVPLYSLNDIYAFFSNSILTTQRKISRKFLPPINISNNFKSIIRYE